MITTEYDLSSKTRAQILFPGKRYFGDCFQYGALSRRLITAYYELGKLNDTIEAGTSELIDDIHYFPLAIALKRLQRSRRDNFRIYGYLGRGRRHISVRFLLDDIF